MPGSVGSIPTQSRQYWVLEFWLGRYTTNFRGDFREVPMGTLRLFGEFAIYRTVIDLLQKIVGGN
ncbi:hypothetical protein DS031_10180 [Bacillus taeanensis]|uniref:Uncharacterized protein n=1 Tax=Bacillus taeanensis TaxID=273032 RepID=A0A366XXT6_9BACI|nr:hypothetical protein DS031_10180 [Bacillus taeanensis]